MVNVTLLPITASEF
ncbi:hypothetical protein VTH06DRAFT_8819 [Thermothelomyces fergusii]